MKRKNIINIYEYLFIALILISSGCSANSNNENKPSLVTIEKTGTSFQLYVNEEPFFIKGAGGSEKLDVLASYGGNSIRTWNSNNLGEILDEAHRNGIKVTAGLWVQHERHGFDYNNDSAVKAQLEDFTQTVEEFKHHPALLMWAIGNEMELNASNPKVWDAVNEIALMIKEKDPNHPTMTVVAEINSDKIQQLNARVPDVDILGINTYGSIGSIPERIRQFGWNRPYVITEWGPNGHWEVPSTGWGAPIEQTSTEKAGLHLSRYEEVIRADEELCLGSYVFLWGQKQERTSTWYGLFLDSGEETEAIDAMQFNWSGSWPANRAPKINSLTINDRTAAQNVRLQLGKVGNATVKTDDPDNDDLKIEWAITPESTDLGVGGDEESRPGEIPGLMVFFDSSGNASFETPEEPGAYRLFVYVLDGNGNAATANIPFYVYE